LQGGIKGGKSDLCLTVGDSLREMSLRDYQFNVFPFSSI
jgi:hypothetical protein